MITGLSVVCGEHRLLRPVQTSYGPLAKRTVLRVRVVHEDGTHGVGEASPLTRFGAGSAASALRTLGDAQQRLPGHSLAEARKAVAACGGDATARWALDVALAGIEARRAGVCLARHLHPAAAGHVTVNALLTETDPARLEAEAAAHVARGTTTLKLKVGHGPGAADRERVAAARAGGGPGVVLRLDANGAWEASDAIRRIRELAAFDLELVEQPVAPGDPAVLARVRRGVGVPIAADEAVRDRASAEALLVAGACDLFVLKPAALGPLDVTRALVARAREAGVDVVLTSLLDGEVSQQAAVHLAAALHVERACGFGPVLEGDTRPLVRAGRVAVP